MTSVAKPLKYRQDEPLTDEEIEAVAAPIRASLQQGAIPPAVSGAKFLRMIVTLQIARLSDREPNGAAHDG